VSPSHLLRALGLGLALTLASPAWGARFVVESAPYSVRTEAEAHLQRVLVETGDARCRVVRRYVRGAGWRYLVALEGVATETEARSLQPRFGGASGEGAIWRMNEDGRVQVAGPVAGAASTKPAAAAPPPAPEAPPPIAKPAPIPPAAAPDKRVVRQQERAAEARLLAAAEAHGGPAGGREALAAAARVRFRYRRALPRESGELVAMHRFVRDGRAMAVTIDVEEGEGVDSRILVAPSGRAFVVSKDEATPRDPARTREILDRFAPESLLSIPLGFAADLAVASAWRGLRLVDDGPKGAVLEHPGGGAGGSGPNGLVRATFDKHNHLVVVDWRDGGAVTRLIYRKYKDFAPGVVLPQEVEVQVDGRTVERLELIELSLDPTLGPKALAEPG
jgi:hypothetical protein